MNAAKKSPSEKTIARAEVEALREKVAKLVEEKPEKAALILSLWINGRKSQKNTPKKSK